MPKRSASPVCSIDGCERPTVARTWCRAHYKIWQKKGDPLAHPQPSPTQKVGQVGCDYPGCGNAHNAGGLCAGHGRQKRTLGEVNGFYADTVKAYADAELSRRDAGASCWTDWPHGWSNHDIPRPVVHVRGKGKVLVARYVFFAVNGYWPTWACHRCPEHPNGEDGQCWNPAHIYDGDPATNGMDRRGPKTWKSARS